MKTTSIGKWLTTIVVACIAAACGNYIDPSDPNNTVPDPAGTVSLRMRNGNNSTELFVEGSFYIYIDAAKNFTNSYANSYLSDFVDMGIMKGLGNVTTLPLSGWAPSVAVTPGHGYIVRTADRQSYLRIYVVDSTAGNQFTTEFNVKYQYPFIPRGF
ncbi:MAG: DUF5036 family protein [Mediterranea sp.]|jgi:hypothetical protein|nr:DUF5036 family protein [Mediterranea sp.]